MKMNKNHAMWIVVMCVTAAIALMPADAGWKDRLPLGKDTLVVKSAGGDIRIDPLAENLFRVRVAKDGAWMESGMNRYGILKGDWAAVKCEKSATSVKTAADLWYNSRHEDDGCDRCAYDVRGGVRGGDAAAAGAGVRRYGSVHERTVRGAAFRRAGA